MHCVKKITDDLIWVGANDRRLSMFEGVYSVPKGVSYNSYLLLDDVTVLFDTVDKAVGKTFFENVEHALAGRELNYLVVQHMEPDHSATMAELLLRHPETTIVCNKKIAAMIGQFFAMDVMDSAYLVDETCELNTGRHKLRFVMAPMVHWPEVMVTFDTVDGVLFSADAFGHFGALNGAIFADEVNFEREYLAEARRYYTNIVGKYGSQVQALLKKAAGLDVRMICPLHGFVWRNNLGDILEKYQKWSAYEPEEKGVMIAYASVYGNTENTAEIISSRLRDKGIPTVMYDVSVTPASEIVADAFRFSHLLFASTTYNAQIFVSMEALLHDLAAHNLQKRTVAFVENGSWAATSGKLMRELLGKLPHMTFLEETLSLKSALKAEQQEQVEALVEALAESVKGPAQERAAQAAPAGSKVDPQAMFKLSYGLFVLTAREDSRDNGCIINTVSQVTSSPNQISITVNKGNLTHDMILKTGVFNVSVLTQEAPFRVFQHFGFQSGRDTDKFSGCEVELRSENGLLYLPKYANALLSGRVVFAKDCGTHTLFVAEVTEAKVLSAVPSVTYEYYFAHIKPKPQPVAEAKTGFVCKICGYFYEGDALPEDFVCPLCKHGPEDFERVG